MSKPSEKRLMSRSGAMSIAANKENSSTFTAPAVFARVTTTNKSEQVADVSRRHLRLGGLLAGKGDATGACAQEPALRRGHCRHCSGHPAGSVARRGFSRAV